MLGFINNYRDRNSKAILQMFPKSLHADVKHVINLLPADIHPPHDGLSFVVDSEQVKINYRIYKLDPTWFLECSLNDNQKLILSCIYTRHPDGFLREKHLSKILANEKFWTTPFVVMLLGEYVVELVQLVEKNLLEKQTQKLYIKFIDENSVFWEKTKSRMINYWYIYYRNRFVDKRDYPGMKIAKIIEKEMRSCSAEKS